MPENLENQKGASSSAEDVKPQKVLLFEKFVKKVEHSIPTVDDFLIKIITTYTLDIRRMNFFKWDKFVEVWACLISTRMTNENSLIFEDGTCFTRQQLELIFGIDFVNAFVPFLLSLQTFSQIELKLFTTVAVLSRTYSDTLFTFRVHFFNNDRAVQKLKDFCAGFFDSDISPKLLKLWELVEQHRNAIKWFRINHWSELHISPHIAMRLNIPVPMSMHKRSVNPTGASSSAEIVETQKIHSWSQWSETLRFYIEKQISFAHACLESLTKKDQACLLKHGLIEMSFCTVSPYMTERSIALRFIDYSKKDLELMYGPDFTNAFTETLLSLKACQLSTVEMKLFNEMVLLNQRPGLVDVEAVQRLQNRAIKKFSLERLKNQINDVDIPPIDILQMFSKLQALSSLHSNSLDWLKENSNKVIISPFFCELFDIPNWILKNI